MAPGRPLFRKITRSIRDLLGNLAENNPDGALAQYMWLWQSMGRQPGRRLIPRTIRFFFMASFDLFSLVGWYVGSRVLPASRRVLRRASVLMLAVALGLFPPLPVSGHDQDVEVVIGTWEGKLDFGGGIIVVFNVERGEDGGLTGTMERPDHTATGIPLSSVTFEDGTLTLVASSVPGTPTFVGTRSEDGTTLRGTFSEGERRTPLELTKRRALPGEGGS